jgi:hypothetical protein
MSDISPPPTELDELLASEFDYIAQTATQANEDRARVSSFYLIAVGSLVAALFGTQVFEPELFNSNIKIMFSGLFGLLTMLGISTIMQLARLRAAWHESMLAMNQMKDFAIAQRPELARAFRWKTSTLPPKYKPASVSYYQAVEVALISGLMFATGVFFLQLALLPETASTTIVPWVFSIVAGIAMVFIQLQIYKRSL